MSSNPLTRTATFAALSRSLRLGLPLALGLTLTALLLWLCGAAPLVRAADLCVHPTGAGGCYTTIQAAVTAAAAAGDTINIAAGTYAEHVIVGAKQLTFIGAGADSTFVDGSNTGRVFSITASSAAFSDLTIQNGHVISDSGGGIYAAGVLMLTNVNMLSNTAESRLTTSGDSDGGGGVRVLGELRVTGGRFENNRVPTPRGEGGAIRSNAALIPHPTVSVSGTTFISNTANHGGAISLATNSWLTNTGFISNTATAGYGGGVFNSTSNPGTMSLSGGYFERNSAGGSGRGGGVHNGGAVVVTDTQFISNTACGNGGGLYANSTATVSGVEFTSNTTTGSSSYGGGLYTGGAATLSDVEFTSNTATGATGSGGGARISSAATLTNHSSSATPPPLPVGCMLTIRRP